VIDDVVVGAGIVGLAHATALAKRGRQVLVVESSPRAEGASIRNFGMVWPIGQPEGVLHQTAMTSRCIWEELAHQSGIPLEPCGSLHLAYHEDELQVLTEYAASQLPSVRRVLAPAEVLLHAPFAVENGLLGGLYSLTEACVEPRTTLWELPPFLSRSMGVEFRFCTTAWRWESGTLHTDTGTFSARRCWVCSGRDARALFPDALPHNQLMPCKLQMMRTAPMQQRIGPMLAAGSTLRHYGCFARCPSLSAVRKRFAEEHPAFDRWGIHVMVSQHASGELTIGDSHEYGDAVSPFDRPEIDALILEYLRSFFNPPELQIAERWHGIYLKHGERPYVTAEPTDDCMVINALGGAGMTLSFGLAEAVVSRALGENDAEL
jgi:FAD dependent oxidoreductase TIGR03364